LVLLPSSCNPESGYNRVGFFVFQPEDRSFETLWFKEIKLLDGGYRLAE
jgi:hypothetical protein